VGPQVFDLADGLTVEKVTFLLEIITLQLLIAARFHILPVILVKVVQLIIDVEGTLQVLGYVHKHLCQALALSDSANLVILKNEFLNLPRLYLDVDANHHEDETHDRECHDRV
jgi:hypothetical protein